jgi:hypothetical protein
MTDQQKYLLQCIEEMNTVHCLRSYLLLCMVRRRFRVAADPAEAIADELGHQKFCCEPAGFS